LTFGQKFNLIMNIKFNLIKIMKETYYKNLNSNEQSEAIEKLISYLNDTEREYKIWKKSLASEKENPTSKTSVECTESICDRYRTRFATLLEALEVMGIHQYKHL